MSAFSLLFVVSLATGASPPLSEKAHRTDDALFRLYLHRQCAPSSEGPYNLCFVHDDGFCVIPRAVKLPNLMWTTADPHLTERDGVLVVARGLMVPNRQSDSDKPDARTLERAVAAELIKRNAPFLLYESLLDCGLLPSAQEEDFQSFIEPEIEHARSLARAAAVKQGFPVEHWNEIASQFDGLARWMTTRVRTDFIESYISNSIEKIDASKAILADSGVTLEGQEAQNLKRKSPEEYAAAADLYKEQKKLMHTDQFVNLRRTSDVKSTWSSVFYAMEKMEAESCDEGGTYLYREEFPAHLTKSSKYCLGGGQINQYALVHLTSTRSLIIELGSLATMPPDNRGRTSRSSTEKSIASVVRPWVEKKHIVYAPKGRYSDPNDWNVSHEMVSGLVDDLIAAATEDTRKKKHGAIYHDVYHEWIKQDLKQKLQNKTNETEKNVYR